MRRPPGGADGYIQPRPKRQQATVGKSLSHKLDLVFSTFIEVTGLITTGASISRIVTPILACACRILGGRAAFALLEKDGKITRISLSSGAGKHRQALRHESVSLTADIARLRRATKAVTLTSLDSPDSIAALSGIPAGREASAVIGAGLVYRKARIGAIAVVIPKRNVPAREDVGLFEVLARQAATAIRNATEFERTQTLSITDGLTGTYNYRFLIDALRKEIGLAQRFNEVFSLVMIDVDGLKEYNDVHGHLGGSEVIRQLAALAASKIRAIDMLCKYGGDEFVVVLPRTPKAGAAVATERLRQLIENHRFPGENMTGKITASFGIASYPVDGTTVQELIASADKALYQAKRHGRNLVWLSGKRTPYSRS